MQTNYSWGIFALALLHVVVSFVMVVLPVQVEKLKQMTTLKKIKDWNKLVWFVSFCVVGAIVILSAYEIKEIKEENQNE